MRALMLLLPLALAGCGASNDKFADAKALIGARCAGCHTVPGVRTATGRVGPPLAGVGRRQIIAGHFSNSRAMLVRWIQHPQAMLPGDAMPETGLSQAQAGRIADYLYSLDD